MTTVFYPHTFIYCSFLHHCHIGKLLIHLICWGVSLQETGKKMIISWMLYIFFLVYKVRSQYGLKATAFEQVYKVPAGYF